MITHGSSLFFCFSKKKKKEGRSRGLNNLRICILEHSHPIFTKNSTLPSQKLFYYLYYTIFKHTQHLNFYFLIQYIKIIYLPNKIYNLKMIEREREKSDSRRERERGEINKIWSLSFTSCYSTILYVRRYCSTIAKLYAIR